MKTLIVILIATFMVGCGTVKNGKTETVVIQTNAECGQCKDRIEGELNYVKGVRFAELDVDSKQLTVKFSPNQVTLQDLKKKVTEIGYDADELNAVPAAQKALPACCKPGGMKKTAK